MEVNTKKLVELTTDLLKEELLDGQFRILQLQLSPQTVHDLLSLYITECEKIVDNLHSIANAKKADFNKIDEQAFRLKGSSVSVGAQRIKDVCEAILNNCKKKNLNECLQSLRRLREEHSLLKSKLEPLLSLLRESAALDGTDQMVESN